MNIDELNISESEMKQLQVRHLIQQRYQQEKLDIEEDFLLFQHPNFGIEPLQGEIYPGGSLDLNLSFTPVAATKYVTSAFCYVSGVENRLPLHIMVSVLI